MMMMKQDTALIVWLVLQLAAAALDVVSVTQVKETKEERPRPFVLAAAKNACLAENVHLAPASSVRIDTTVDMWVTFTLNLEHCHWLDPVVVYGTDETDVNDRSATPAERVQFAFHPHFYSSYESSWIYHVMLPNLTVSTDYWYQIRVSDIETIVTYRFQTPPPLATPTTLAIVGDWGESADAMKTMRVILNEVRGAIHDISAASSRRRSLRQPNQHTETPPPISALLVVGDLSYANGYLPAWESWLTAMQPLLHRLPLLVAPGNHELECDARNYRLFQAYQHYFRTPNYRPPTAWEPVPLSHRMHTCTHTAQETWSVYEGGNSYYQYRQGLAHVIVLNSYTSTAVGSPQHEFLTDALQQADRKWTPWLIVVFHCPFHTTFIGHNDEINPTLMQQSFGPLFDQYGVNLVFSGHQHAYVRSHSMDYNNTIDDHDASPIYLTVGTGGDSHARGYRNGKPEPWVASADHTTFGSGKLQLVNATHAFWERMLTDNLRNTATLRDPTWFVNRHALPNGKGH
jgi:hypothetical protein